MRVLLRADVEGLGKKGDLIEVADGYGRNYLVPQGLGLPATPGIETQAQTMRRARHQRDTRDRQAATDVATAVVGHPVTIAHRAGEGGKLFGSVTTTEIAAAVEAQLGVVIDRRQLALDEPIRTVGSHLVMAKLHAEVEFPVSVEVVAEG